MNKYKILLSILVAAAFLATKPVSGESIKIYLPREVNITGDTFVLGDVAIVRGSGKDAAKASATALGKFSAAGQKIVVSRITILSRLASNKIPSGSVMFTGAREIKVGRKELTIKADDIAGKAREFLEKNKTDASIASYELIRKSRNIVLESQKGEVTFVPRMGRSNSSSQVVVDVDVMLAGKKTGTNQVMFRPMYNRRQVIAKKDMPAGAILTDEDIEVKTIVSKYPEAKGWALPVGLVAKRPIKRGQLICNSQVTRPRPKILVKRNNKVVIKIETPAISLVVNGKALGEGSFGETIKVKNVESGRIIICRINYDGTVSPVG